MGRREPADRPRTTTPGRVSARLRVTNRPPRPPRTTTRARLRPARPGLQHRPAVPAGSRLPARPELQHRAGLRRAPGLQHRAAVPAGSRLPARPELQHRAGLRRAPGLQHRAAVPAGFRLPGRPGLRPRPGPGARPAFPAGSRLPASWRLRARPGPRPAGRSRQPAALRGARSRLRPAGHGSWRRTDGPVRRRAGGRPGGPCLAGRSAACLAGRYRRGSGNHACPCLRAAQAEDQAQWPGG